MATLTVTQNQDFRGGATETNVTDIVFQTSGTSVATFEPAQFGTGLISDTVTITGDSFNNLVDIKFSSSGSFSAAGWQFAANWNPAVDTVVFEGTDDSQTITGSSQHDRIIGQGGADHIDAGAGDDEIQITETPVPSGTTIEGGAGTDKLLILFVSPDLQDADISGVEVLRFNSNNQTAIVGGDQIGDNGFSQVDGVGGGATSLIVRGTSVDLAGVEFLNWAADDTVTIEGSDAILNVLIGSDQKDTIGGTGNSVDLMVGGDGADTQNGGGGADFFDYRGAGEVDAGETINGGAGTDSIRFQNAGANDFRNATITDVEAIDYVSGNSTATFAGDSFDSGEIATVSGSAGIDQLIVTTDDQFTDIGGVTFTGWTNGTDTITIQGSAVLDILGGSAQADIIDGGAAADSMEGRAGNDTYVVDVSNDAISEAAGDGTDLVQSSATAFTLANNVENLTLTGSANINGTGNSLANVITGNSGKNTLNGGTSPDTLQGGAGNDTYVVDNAGDKAIETNGNGTDLVQSSVSFSIAGQFVENLTLTGSGNVNATGNSLDNALAGNSGNNSLDGGSQGNDTLNGGTGADHMEGGNGSDTYVVDNAGDTVVEANVSGSDLVRSSVSFSLAGQFIENLTLTGSGNVNATGNSLDNTIAGNSGNNTLAGASGADTFFFNTALNAATNLDHITDFAAVDTIDLENAVFTSLTTTGTLAASAFVSGAGLTSAQDADDRIVYNTTTGALFFDADGVGGAAAIQFAILDNHAALTNADFVVI
jgi:Ca2+-binding RTX toxin-like protein